MKKNFYLIIVSFFFVGFVTYATIQTNSAESKNFTNEATVINDPQIKPNSLEILPNESNTTTTKNETIKDSVVTNPTIEKINTPVIIPTPIKNNTLFNNEEKYDD